MSPETQTALTVALSSIGSGIASVLASTRMVRRRLRRLERTVSKTVVPALDELRAGQARLSAESAQHTRRLSWAVGGLQSLLAVFRVRHPGQAVALDAESTAGAPARAR